MGPSVSARLCSALLCCLGWIAALRGPAVAGPCVLALPVSALAAAFTSEAFLTALVLLGCPPREAHWKARGQLPMPGTRCRLHRGAETQPPSPSRPWLPAPPSGSAAGLAVGVRAVPLPNSAEPGRKFRPPWYGRLSGAVEGCPPPPPPRPGPGLWADCISPRSGSRVLALRAASPSLAVWFPPPSLFS